MWEKDLFMSNLMTSNITKNPYVESYKLISNMLSSMKRLFSDIKKVIHLEKWIKVSFNNDMVLLVYPISTINRSNSQFKQDLSNLFINMPKFEQPYLEECQKLENLIISKFVTLEIIEWYIEGLYQARNVKSINQQIIIVNWIIKDYLLDLKNWLGDELYVKIVTRHSDSELFNIIDYVNEDK